LRDERGDGAEPLAVDVVADVLIIESAEWVDMRESGCVHECVSECVDAGSSVVDEHVSKKCI
jgi:hypothetical protein